MGRRAGAGAVLAAVAMSLLVVGAPEASATTCGASVSIKLSPGFAPSTVTVAPGTTVCWTNNDASLHHTVTSDDDGTTFDSGPTTPGMAPGETFQFPFTGSGSFAYHCKIHPSMHGTVVIGTAPAAPAVSSTDPPSPSNVTTPKIIGSGESGSSIQLYTDSACTQTIGALTPEATFEDPGIQVTVAEGSTTLYATATNAIGTSPCSTSSVTYDLDPTAPSPPTISSVSGSTPGSKTNPVVNGTAEDGSTVTISDDPSCLTSLGTTSSDGSFAFTLPEGASLTTGSAETFYATATDAVGNVSACSTGFGYTAPPGPDAQITSDVTDPTNDNTPTFTVGSTDGDVVLACSLDQGVRVFGACPLGSTGPLADGAWTFALRVTRQADPSDDTIVTRTFTVDTTPPTITTIAGPGRTRTRRPKFTITSDDPNATYECEFGSSGFVPAAGNVCQPAKGLRPGKHKLTVRATDAADNAAEKTKTFTILR